MASSMMASAMTEPTERSMPAVRMTRYIPSASSACTPIWRTMLVTFCAERKYCGCKNDRAAAITTTMIRMPYSPSSRERRSRSSFGGGASAWPFTESAISAHPVVGEGLGVSLRAHDPADHLVAAGRLERRLGEVAAVEDRHHPVGDIEHVVHPVADQNDADAVLLEALDEVEHLADLLDRQRGGRLVHDDDAGVEGGGAADGDGLLLAAGEFLDRLVDRLHPNLQAIEMVRGHLAALLPVDDGEAADASARFAAEIDVLVDRHVPGEGKVLIDHLYADRARVAWAVETDGSSLEKELAGARRVEPGENLHQRRLAGAVVADDAEHFAALQLQADGI